MSTSEFVRADEERRVRRIHDSPKIAAQADEREEVDPLRDPVPGPKRTARGLSHRGRGAEVILGGM